VVENSKTGEGERRGKTFVPFFYLLQFREGGEGGINRSPSTLVRPGEREGEKKRGGEGADDSLSLLNSGPSSKEKKKKRQEFPPLATSLKNPAVKREEKKKGTRLRSLILQKKGEEKKKERKRATRPHKWEKKGECCST